MFTSPSGVLTKHKMRQNSCHYQHNQQHHWGDISVINPFNQGFLEDEPSFLNNDLLIVRQRTHSQKDTPATTLPN